MRPILRFPAAAVIALLAACANQAPAPVSTYGLHNETEGGIAIARQGETVYDVSQRFRLPVRDVIELNNLEPPYRLAPGQRLRLPRPQTHTVARGDTPASIARTYGVSQSQLMRLNGLDPDSPLPQGQALHLPHAGSGFYDVASYEPPPAASGLDRGGAAAAIAPPARVDATPLDATMAPPTAYDRLPSGPVSGPDSGIAAESLTPQPLIDDPGPTAAADWRPPPALPGLPDGPPPPAARPPAPALPAATQHPEAIDETSPFAAPGEEPRGIDLPAPGTRPATVAAGTAVATAAALPPVKPPAAPATTTPAAVTPSVGKMLRPVEGKIISGFGPKSGGGRNDGINIAAAKGTAVRSAAAGTVVYAGNELRSFGYLVLVNHGNNLVTAYAHMDGINVKRGQAVTAGQTLGKVGKTGEVDSPQLHFEVRKKGKPVDPMGWLKG